MNDETNIPKSDIVVVEVQQVTPQPDQAKAEVSIDEKTSSTVEFLLAEFQEMNQEFRRTKEEGLARLNFFIALTTSILGGLVALSEFSSISPDSWKFVSVGALLFLLSIGWGFHQFTIDRGISTDVNIRAMARIRRYFIDQDPAIVPYMTWPLHDEPSKWVIKNNSIIRRTTQIMVGLTLALFVGLLLSLITAQLLIVISAGILSFFAGFQLLRFYANKQYKQAADEAKRDMRFPQNS